MIDFINQHEPVLRGLVFAASLGLLAVFEIAFPRRFLGARLARSPPPVRADKTPRLRAKAAAA